MAQQTQRAQKQVTPTVFSALMIFFSFIFLIAGPSALYSYPPANMLILAINTVWGIILIAASVLDYMKNKKDPTKLTMEYVMIVLGIITFFFYSHFYGTPWIQNYHLYIFPISQYGSIFFQPHYQARDMLSATSYMTGIMLILLAVGEIHVIRTRYQKA